MISTSREFNDPKHELWSLLEGLCEDRLSAEDFERLETWILTDAEAMRIYRDYIDLHGSLYWDTALAGKPVPQVSASVPEKKPPRSRLWKQAVTAIACLFALVLGLWSGGAFDKGPDESDLAKNDNPAAERPENSKAGSNTIIARDAVEEPKKDFIDNSPWPAIAERRPQPRETLPKPPGPSENIVAKNPNPPAVPPRFGSVDEIVAAVNAEIRQGWDDAEIKPSPIADDAEWLRRVHLDLIGQIPTVETAREFLADRSEDKRAKMVNELLDDPAYVRHFATVWTNLLVGRSTERDVDRVAVYQFLRQSFGRNRPWSETVQELVAAEGSAEENGAAGFLLAHLNNQAVPATAITARLFLGIQVQCTQCHKHPHNDALQSQFWELNSFFKQTKIERRRIKEPGGGSRNTRSLVSRSVGGETTYEDLNGVMQVAYPKFAGVEISPEAGINRRRELAKLLVHGETPQIAKAMVNRMWAHFFGYGFTRPVDDMGPHIAPSHPDLLERLAREFVQSGYDVKQLIRWICLSDPYQRTSQFTAENERDNPSIGETPLFSRMYVRPMTAEQLYDSLLVASKAHFASGSSWDEIQAQRQEWLQQFVTAFDTEENDEETRFEGTVPQALLLMNSELIDQAVLPKRGTYFSEVLYSSASDTEKIRKLSLAALSRYPTRGELAAAKKMIQARKNTGRRGASTEALQDVFWAFLNSNEFILVH